jgi:prepilin-type N-terminal cleavage/methylation domain-containing protein
MFVNTREKTLQKGFTLVELLIVVIILAILAAILVPQFASSTDDAKASAADSTLANLRASLDLYYQQHGDYPGAVTAVPSAACGGTAGNGVATGGAGLTAEDAMLEQLSLYTDAVGGACSQSSATLKFGPYLKKATLPPDPFKGVSTIDVVNTGDLIGLVATGADFAASPGGYKYDSSTGKIIFNVFGEDGR